MRNLLWLRRDLRLADNPALSAAVAAGLPVVAVYIDDCNEGGPWPMGSASRWYLQQSLLNLRSALAAIGVPLEFHNGRVLNVMNQLTEEHELSRVYWNRVVEPDQLNLDGQVRTMLFDRGIDTSVFADDCLLNPEQVRKRDGTPYRVFTPFWRRAQEILETDVLQPRLLPRPETAEDQRLAGTQQDTHWQIAPTAAWCNKLAQHWQAGEAAASERFETFLQQALPDYDRQRDLPAVEGTSGLSAALHFGEISVARVYSRCRQILLLEQDESTRKSIRRFLAEIGWREFARHLLHAFPNSPQVSLDQRFEHAQAWEPDPDDRLLKAWQRGETGIPLVDAGMRQLWASGWMHNRVRMITASFLTKNLGIHWREGARWFWDTLVDADLASNTLGWQWVAGCGADAAPYFRVFNPMLQANKFDPEGHYLSRWLPEQQPLALVDIRESRERALRRYQSLGKAQHQADLDSGVNR